MSYLQTAQETLGKVSLFMDFDPHELDAFIEFTDPIRCRKGDVLIRQGEPGQSLFIVIEGTLEAIVRLENGRNFVLSKLKGGDFFGELSIVDEYPRSANVVAMEDCVLLKVTSLVVETFFKVYPSAAYKILLAIARSAVSRVRETDRRYLDFISRPDKLG